MRLLLLAICMSLCLLTGCREAPKEYSTHGISLILIDSQWERLCGGLGVEAHLEMANKDKPEQKATSRTWKEGESKDVVEKECSISTMEFLDSNNNSNVIEKICIKDKGLLLIKCTSTDDQATINLRDKLVSILNRKGFKQVD